MSISLIVAMTHDRVIGIDNKLPWHLSEDLKRFKALTMGHPIVMGRKTYESIGKPLPGRENIVLTRDRNYQVPGVTIVHDLKEGLKRDGEIFVIGGAEIFKEAFPLAEKLYLTFIEQPFEGDTWFPQWDEKAYEVLEDSGLLHSEKNGLPYRFVTLQKNN